MGFEKVDVKILILCLLLGVVVVFTVVGDIYTFVREPVSMDQKLFTIPTALGYRLLQDRVSADGFTFAFYLCIIGPASFLAYRAFIIYIMEPWEMDKLWRLRIRRAKHAERKRFGG